MRRRDLVIAPVILGLAACAPDGPVAPGTDEPVEDPEEDSMACPDTYDYQLREGVEGPDGKPVPRTDSGGRISLTANVVDHSAQPPVANIAWQTSPPSDLPGGDRVFMGQQVGDVLEIDGVRLEVTGICAGRVTLEDAG